MKKMIRRSALIAILVVLLLALSVSFASASGGSGNYHRVSYGETLFSIGRLYGVNPYLIAEVNGLYDPDHIYAGQVLYIPSGDGSWGNCGWNNCGNSWNNCGGWNNNCDNSWNNVNWNDRCDSWRNCDDGWNNVGYRDGRTNYHTVRRGETLHSISRLYGVSPWTIAETNGIYNLNRIYAGQTLYIPSGGGYYW